MISMITHTQPTVEPTITAIFISVVPDVNVGGGLAKIETCIFGTSTFI